MERMTYDFCMDGNHCWQVKGADNLECREVCERQGDAGCKTCPIAKAFDRLATIEDTLGDEYDLNLVQRLIQAYKEGRYIIMKEPEQAGVSRLRELAQADREGRCVVLPCKVEDDVYINILGRTLPFTVISISQMASTPTFKAQHGIRLVYIFKADDVGETVFMTRAEAEAALRREQE